MTTYRHRAFLDHDPGVSARVLRVPPGAVTERWEADKALGNVPERWTNEDRLRGVVRRVIGKRATHHPTTGRPLIDDHAGKWEVIVENQPAHRAPLGAVLAVLSGVMLCPPRDLFALLDHLAGQHLHADGQRVAVAAAYRSWISDQVPLDVVRAARVAGRRSYDTAAQWSAFLDGVTAVLGDRVVVGVPPYDVDVPPERITPAETRTARLRPGAAERIIRDRTN